MLAIARAAIDAGEFTRAREALAPFIAAPTQRVAMLMAEIERTEHGDSGRARAWTLRAVRALHDPVWTADGYVCDRWRPVSPVTGRLDAFQWQTPVAALPSDKTVAMEASPFNEAMLAAPPSDRRERRQMRRAEPPREPAAPGRAAPPAAQDNFPPRPSRRRLAAAPRRPRRPPNHRCRGSAAVPRPQDCKPADREAPRHSAGYAHRPRAR